MDVLERSRSKNIETKDKQAIISLHVLSSGWAEQHKEHRFGSKMPQLWWILTSRSWVKLPINYFLIEHKDGLILFDTGLDPTIASDKRYISKAIGRFLLSKIFRLDVSDDDRLDRQLAAEGYQASDVRTAVISHLHFDHVGGIKYIPQADLIVSEAEWSILSAPHPEYEWILREHIEIPQAKWQPIKFELSNDPLFEGFNGVYDVAGDGSMILLPTPGHTAGSLSMLIRNPGWAPILLVADLAYEGALLEKGIFPGTGDKRALRDSYEKVQALKERLSGLVIVPSHDFAANEQIAKATRLADSDVYSDKSTVTV